MRVAGERDRSCLRILLAQFSQAADEHLARFDDGRDGIGVERRGIGGQVARQLPDRLLVRARRRPRDVVRRVGRPAEMMQRRLRRTDQRRHDIVRARMVGMRAIGMIAFKRNLIDRVAAEDLRELRHLRDEQDEIRKVGLDPRDLGARQTSRAVRHAERQACDAIGRDREAAAGKRKARVVWIEAVLRLRAVRPLDRRASPSPPRSRLRRVCSTGQSAGTSTGGCAKAKTSLEARPRLPEPMRLAVDRSSDRAAASAARPTIRARRRASGHAGRDVRD